MAAILLRKIDISLKTSLIMLLPAMFLSTPVLSQSATTLIAESRQSHQRSALTDISTPNSLPVTEAAEEPLVQKSPTPDQSSNITLTYCIDPDWMPYEALRDRKHTGISSDYLQLVAARTGIDFQLVVTQSWQQSLDFLQSGKCHATTFLNQSDEREVYLNFSASYFRSPNVIVSQKDQTFLNGLDNIGTRKLAITRGYRILEYVKAYYPNVDTFIVDNEKQGLESVADGTADLFVGSQLFVNTYIGQKQLYDLKIAGWAGAEDELRMAVIDDYQYLLPALNNALASITEAEHVKIYRKWNHVAVIDDTNYELVWQIIGVTAIVILLLLARNFSVSHYNRQLAEKNFELEGLKERLEKSNSELAFLSNHDPLTNLYNRNYFNQRISEDHRATKDKESPVCLVVIDIDHFKDINDCHGHQAGDHVLMELSMLLSCATRDEDIVARWGGEEFVILCNHSTMEESKKLCQRIQVAIETHEFTQIEHITCSFGIAELFENEQMNACFERADKALYKAKDKGRDQICVAFSRPDAAKESKTSSAKPNAERPNQRRTDAAPKQTDPPKKRMPE